MRTNNSKIEVLTPRPADGWKEYPGHLIWVKDNETGKRYNAKIRLKEVRCGKRTCHRCPHKIYAYAQFRKGKKVTEKYLGVAR